MTAQLRRKATGESCDVVQPTNYASQWSACELERQTSSNDVQSIHVHACTSEWSVTVKVGRIWETTLAND